MKVREFSSSLVKAINRNLLTGCRCHISRSVLLLLVLCHLFALAMLEVSFLVVLLFAAVDSSLLALGPAADNRLLVLGP